MPISLWYEFQFVLIDQIHTVLVIFGINLSPGNPSVVIVDRTPVEQNQRFSEKMARVYVAGGSFETAFTVQRPHT